MVDVADPVDGRCFAVADEEDTRRDGGASCVSVDGRLAPRADDAATADVYVVALDADLYVSACAWWLDDWDAVFGAEEWIEARF